MWSVDNSPDPSTASQTEWVMDNSLGFLTLFQVGDSSSNTVSWSVGEVDSEDRDQQVGKLPNATWWPVSLKRVSRCWVLKGSKLPFNTQHLESLHSQNCTVFLWSCIKISKTIHHGENSTTMRCLQLHHVKFTFRFSWH